MTDTVTVTPESELLGHVTYRNDENGPERREWLYVVAILADMLFGVAFTNDSNNPRPTWVTVPRNSTRADVDTQGYGRVIHPLTILPWWVDMLAEFFRAATDGPRVSGDQDTDQAYARGVADGRQESDARHEAWVSSLVSDAHEFADEHSLCSEFDRFMSEHDLPTRRREYTVTLGLSHTVAITVEARDEDQAAEEAVSRFRDYPRDYVNLGDVEVDVEDVEEE